MNILQLCISTSSRCDISVTYINTFNTTNRIHFPVNVGGENDHFILIRSSVDKSLEI